MVSIQQHTFQLCQSLYQQMSALSHHSTALKLCTIYGNHHLQDPNWQGSILTFNLKWADGSWVGFNEVERLAIESNIQLRTGLIASLQSLLFPTD
jgi:molybdenum cofactor sulfurtransferase